jgi:hypothetical protein
METSEAFAIQSTEIQKTRKSKNTSFEMASAKGAALILSLGLRPRIRRIQTASAESAIHFRRQFDASWRDAQSQADLLFTSQFRAESRFQRLFTCDRIPGAMPQARMTERL